MAKFFNCCANCTPETGRCVGCHATCEKYIKDKEDYDKRQQNLRDIKNKENIMYYNYIYS